MDIRTVGLLGAIAGAATIVTAHAAPAAANETAPSPAPSSYTDLLAPVADPVAQLKAHDAALRERDAGSVAPENGRDSDVRRVDNHHHHHHDHGRRRGYHHHERRRSNRRHHHHHHHHHHDHLSISISG